MKRVGVWRPLLPQIYKTEQCKSLCKRQIIFETRLNQPWVLKLRQNEYNHFSGYRSINQSRDVVVSLACYSYSKLVKLGEFKSVKNDYLNGDVTLWIFWNWIFRIKIRAEASTFLSLRFFLLYQYTHGARERKMYFFVLIYFQGCKCRGEENCLRECDYRGTPIELHKGKNIRK